MSGTRSPAPLDGMVPSQSPLVPTQCLSPAAQLPWALPVTPDRTLKGRDGRSATGPQSPRNMFIVQVAHIAVWGLRRWPCAQLSAGWRKDTTARGRKPNSCPPWERAWPGEAEVVCKAQARGSAPAQKAPPITALHHPSVLPGLQSPSWPLTDGQCQCPPCCSLVLPAGRTLGRVAWSQRENTSRGNV